MPDLAFETAHGGRVAGVDEAGRGPLAGPVVAAAVILDVKRLDDALAETIDDCKLLRREQREAIAAGLAGCATIGIGAASVAEIARWNILGATYRAMARAVAALGVAPELALVDGDRTPPLPCPAEPVVGGDGRSLSIAAASVVAKVLRDRGMARLAARYPGYGWEHNAGYGTAEHREAIARLGPTPHHRMGFAPLVQLGLPLDGADAALPEEGAG